MNQRLFLILLLILSSCTVTKRLYTKGYNIERNKIYSFKSTLNQNKKEQDIEIKNDLSENDSSDQSSIKTKEELVNEDSYFVEYNSDSVVLKIDVIEKNKEWEDTLEVIEEVPSVQNKDKTEVSQKDKKKSKKQKLKIWGIVLLGLGILFWLGALSVEGEFLYNVFDALVFSGNGFFVAILGFIVFLGIGASIVLFYLIVMGIGYNAGLAIAVVLAVIGLALLVSGFLIKQ